LKTETPFGRIQVQAQPKSERFFLGRSHHCALSGGGFVNVAKYYKVL